MAPKKRNLTEKFKLEPRFPKYAGYLDYILKTSASVKIRSGFEEAAQLTVSAVGTEGLIVPFEEEVSVPFESAVRLEVSNIFSPLYLAENDALKQIAVKVTAKHEGKEVASETCEITALPFDWWEGLSGNSERVAAFVRPRLPDCSVVLADAGKRLKRWKADAEFYGYAGTDKNAVRQIIAAVYAAIKACGIERNDPCDLSAPLSASREALLKEKNATVFQLALFAASCLEAARLHPVLALGKNGVGVGVWLYDSCFLDTPSSRPRKITSKPSSKRGGSRASSISAVAGWAAWRYAPCAARG